MTNKNSKALNRLSSSYQLMQLLEALSINSATKHKNAVWLHYMSSLTEDISSGAW